MHAIHTHHRRHLAVGAALLGAVVSLTACSSSSSNPAEHVSSAAANTNGKILAVGAENQYANVISQIGGKYVTATAIESNPNTDPHTFEASSSVSRTVQAASLVVQNGVGYDDFMTKIEGAAPNAQRKVIDVQKLLGLPDDTPNPHLWYNPETMPAVAKELVSDLSALQPAHAAYFRANETTFLNELKPWTTALAAFKSEYPNTPVAVTEPVADYMLQAAGTKIMTPFSLQAAIMNGTDPAPQDVSSQGDLFSGKKVKVFCYNQQVTDSITETFLSEAKAAHIPVVGVYETMPTDGYDYQTWMLAELKAVKEAVVNGTSTEKL